MPDVPMESPRKYGSFDDDLDELASAIAGHPVSSKPNLQPDPSAAVGSQSDEVDADFLRRLTRDSGSKYGDF